MSTDDIDPNDPAVCGVDQDNVPDHEHHRGGKAPRARLRKRAKGRLGLSACAVPGISLTNYRVNAQGKGWGAPCAQARTTITLSNGVRITTATGIARLTTLVLNEVIRRGYNIRQADTGSYNCRKIAGTNTWSNHAWALAIDINWNSNPYTTSRITDKPQWMFDLMNRYGFANGADYTGKRDWMHHEFMGTPAQAAAATALAERELAGGGGGGGGGGGTLPTYAPGSRVLYLQDPHMNGTDVQKLQNVLKAWYPNEAWAQTAGFNDGDFGPLSDTAVRFFQTKAGLTVDGEAGPATWQKLGF